MRDWDFSTLPRRDTGRNAHVFKTFSIPIRIMAAIRQHVFGRWKLIKKRPSSDVITGLARTQKHPDWPADGIGYGVKFRVHPTLGAPDQASTPPFFSPRLEAVRCVFRCVASIMSVSVSLP